MTVDSVVSELSCSIERESLLGLLSSAQSVVSRKGAAQVFSNVLLSIKGNVMTLIGTSMDLSVISSVACSSGHGEVVLMGFMLFDIVRKLPGGCDVLLRKSADGDTVDVIGGKSEFKLPTMDPARFPKIDYNSTGVGARLSCEDCFKLFDRVGFAISVDETRQFLCGARVSIDECNLVSAVATNGHRLALMRVKAEMISEGFESFILPRRAVFEVMRNAYTVPKDSSVMISVHNNRAIFTFPNTVIVSKLIDANYPDINRIIPGRDSSAFVVDTVVFLEALERVSAILLNKSNAVSLGLSHNMLRISAQALEYGSSACEELPVQYEGASVMVSINSKYLTEIVSRCVGDKFICHIKTPDDPLLCLDDKNHEFLFVVMPVKA